MNKVLTSTALIASAACGYLAGRGLPFRASAPTASVQLMRECVEGTFTDERLRKVVRTELDSYRAEGAAPTTQATTTPEAAGSDAEVALTAEEDKLYGELRRRLDSALARGIWRPDDDAQMEQLLDVAASKAAARELAHDVIAALNDGRLRREEPEQD